MPKENPRHWTKPYEGYSYYCRKERVPQETYGVLDHRVTFIEAGIRVFGSGFSMQSVKIFRLRNYKYDPERMLAAAKKYIEKKFHH